MKTMKKHRGTTILDSLWIWLFLMTIVFWGCAEKRHVVHKGPALKPPATIEKRRSSKIVKVSPGDREIIERMLRDAYDDWNGTPHHMGGCSKKGVDCSCFVRKIYEDVFHYDVKTLPRTVKGLSTMKKGKRINKNDLQPGDLVIFEQPPPWYKYHVGIYLGGNEFMHASKSKGVMISRMDDPYHWEKYYSKTRRLLKEKDKQEIVERRSPVGGAKGADEIVVDGIKMIEYGKASYYADKFHGRTTACGDRYDRNQLTAAHREPLSCGSVCRVTNLANEKGVVVVINDRGPFKKGRIIDLSHRAMKQLDGITDGVIGVKLEVLQIGENPNERLTQRH